MSDYSFTDDILDVRDLIERFEELESERDNFLEEKELDEQEKTNSNNPAVIKWEESEDGKEYLQLFNLLGELCGNGGDKKWRGDWYPITLINSDYFTEYTKELVEDWGYVRRGDGEKELPWWISIDWDDTAENVKVDYSTIDIEDETYYY